VNRRWQWAVVAGVIGVAAVGITMGVRSRDTAFVLVAEGVRAPDFRAVTLDAAPEVRTLADYRGQVTVLNVWATYCAPCRIEMPSFQRLYEEFRDDGLRIVAVSIDAPGMEKPIRDFVAEFGLTFDILYDSPGAIQRDYMTAGVPETFVIGRNGVIRLKELGYEEWDAPERKAFFQKLLAEQPD
jgi:peroxiredoxin